MFITRTIYYFNSDTLTVSFGAGDTKDIESKDMESSMVPHDQIKNVHFSLDRQMTNFLCNFVCHWNNDHVSDEMERYNMLSCLLEEFDNKNIK